MSMEVPKRCDIALCYSCGHQWLACAPKERDGELRCISCKKNAGMWTDE